MYASKNKFGMGINFKNKHQKAYHNNKTPPSTFLIFLPFWFYVRIIDISTKFKRFFNSVFTDLISNKYINFSKCPELIYLLLNNVAQHSYVMCLKTCGRLRL